MDRRTTAAGLSTSTACSAAPPTTRSTSRTVRWNRTNYRGIPMPRLEYDAYMTPPHYIAALLSEVNIFGSVCEPCVGDGAIADALRTLPSVRRVATNDIDKKRKADSHFDAR